MNIALLAPTAKRASRGEVLVLLAGVAAALPLCVAALDARSLWFDEAFSVAIARLPVPQIWNLVARTDAHPPLYYLLLHVWLLLGDMSGGERTLVWSRERLSLPTFGHPRERRPPGGSRESRPYH